MKQGTLTFRTDGDTIQGSFTDHLGNTSWVLTGRSMDDCTKAIGDMVLLMQHRNGIGNYNPDGSIADGVSEDMKLQLTQIAGVDNGIGW